MQAQKKAARTRSARSQTAGLVALRKTNLRNTSYLIKAAEMYLDLYEQASKQIGVQGRQFSVQSLRNSPELRNALIQASATDCLDAQAVFEDARGSMDHRFASAVDKCLLYGESLIQIGSRYTDNTRHNDVAAVAVSFIKQGLMDLARKFRLFGGRE